MAAQLFNNYNQFITHFDEEFTHPMTKEYLVIKYPSIAFGMIAMYLLSIKIILPAYMRKRPAYELKSAIFYYNIFQVFASAYCVYLSYGSGYFRRYSIFKCRDLDYNATDPDSVMALNAIYFYLLLKYIEFLDTIFFVLRKKDNQVSFLHVYHHASMAFNGWLALKIAAGGATTLATGLNSLIHVVMYTYYLLAGLGPQWQKYLWWKKYLTRVQITQFIVGLFIIFSQFATYQNCPNLFKRHIFIIYFTLYVASILFLFFRFYTKAYKPQDKEHKRKAQKIQ